MGGPIRLQRTGQIGFYLAAGGVVAITELHTNTGGAVALGAARGDPHDLTGYWNFFRLIHQVEQQKHLIAQLVGFAGGLGPLAASYGVAV